MNGLKWTDLFARAGRSGRRVGVLVAWLVVMLASMSLWLGACGDPAPSQEGKETLAEASPEQDSGTEQTSPDEASETPAVKPISIPYKAECDNLNPTYCPFPWPSMRYLKPNDKTVTKYRLEYNADALATTDTGKQLDPTPFQRLDGFSTNTQILTMFKEPVDVTGLPSKETIDASLEKDSPTVLIELETGKRIAHWVENDARSDDPKQVVFFIRPAVPLDHNKSYGVVLRGLKGKSGELLEPSAAFRALRDKIPTDQPDFEKRRSSFDDLFATLEGHGIKRAGMQAAWKFHTSSFEANHNAILSMRDDAIKRLGQDGIGCSADKVDEDYKGTGARVIRGTIKVPFYMTADKLPGALARDDNDMPKYTKDADIKFTAVIPKSLLDNPKEVPLVVLGHGLFGEADGTLRNKDIIALVDQFSVVMVGTDWAGMSRGDLPFLATALADPSKFYMVGEMLRQAMINKIAMTRTVLGKCRDLKEFKQKDTVLIDRAKPYYIGVSQGAILGGTLLTLSPDFERGILFVGGTSFSFMIERSIHFTKFETFLKPAFPDRIDRAMLMALSQHVWDRAESGNYLRHTTKGIKGGTPKSFLYVIAENDSQVPNLSSDLGARLAGIPVMEGSVRKPWGIPVQTSPYKGSAYISYHYGDPANPDGNLSPPKDFGGHSNVPVHPLVGKMIFHFLETGEVRVECKDKLCDLRKQ